MLVKKLVQHGNSQAIPLDKQTLLAASLDKDSLFQVSILPNGGLIITSVQPTNDEIVKKSFSKILKKNLTLFKGLAEK
jgi:hypothetical protein